MNPGDSSPTWGKGSLLSIPSPPNPFPFSTCRYLPPLCNMRPQPEHLKATFLSSRSLTLGSGPGRWEYCCSEHRDAVASQYSDFNPCAAQELLARVALLALIFVRMLRLFSIPAVPVHTPTNTAQTFPFLHNLASLPPPHSLGRGLIFLVCSPEQLG